MAKVIYGYARVSTVQQDTEVQEKQLKALGCTEIITEKATGTSLKERVGLQRIINESRDGDTVIVMKLDRLARNTIDTLEIAQAFKAKGVKLILKDMDLDLSGAAGEMILTVMASLAQMEAARIKERCTAGRKAAKAKGVHLGRKMSIPVEKIVMFTARGMNPSQVAQLCKVSRASVYKALKIDREAKEAAAEEQGGNLPFTLGKSKLK